MARYINPFTDFGFKLIFGTEQSKPFLISFLNSVLEDEPGYEPVVDISYNDKESPGETMYERNAIFDILCTTDKGHHFIVEMQNARQQFFIDRSIFYASRAISRQGERGNNWEFKLNPVYVISLLNFRISDLGTDIRTDAALCNLQSREMLSDRLRFIFIQLPNFKIEVPDDCVGNFDRWLYTLNHMEKMDRIPFAKDDNVFAKLSDIIDYANLSEAARNRYDADLQVYRDSRNQLAYALREGHAKGHAKGLEEGHAKGLEEGHAKGLEEGRKEGLEEGLAKGLEEGRKEGLFEVAKKMKNSGMDICEIARMTGVAECDIANL